MEINSFNSQSTMTVIPENVMRQPRMLSNSEKNDQDRKLCRSLKSSCSLYNFMNKSNHPDPFNYHRETGLEMLW